MLYGKGFTLNEVMLALAILAILATKTLPSMNTFIVKMRVDNEITQLHRLLLLTRNLAINSGRNATLCPVENNECIDDWQKELVIFIDDNKNQKLDADEQIFKHKAPINTADKLLYGLRRNRIEYKANGYLSGLSNGTFRYCPYKFDNLSRGIVIATSGRVYQSKYSEKRQRDVNRNNKAISCLAS